MPNPLCRAALLAVFLAVVVALPSAAQPASGFEYPPLDAPLRAAIVDSITAAIDSIYVLEQPAKRIVAQLNENLQAGVYDEFTDVSRFAQRLYEDCQAVHRDGHFGIEALPPLDPALLAENREADPADEARQERRERVRNYSFRKAEILAGGVGYLRFDGFGWGPEAFEAASAAMNFLANCEAVIFDVRTNGGGSAAMIRHLCGYLFERRQHLINWEVRAEGMTEQSYSPDFVPGRKLSEQLVYVLTSRRTFSAAEEFSFDLKNLERATLVGETTGGGGHTVRGYAFHFEGFRILIRLPYGRAYNPATNQGWEGVGVTPHVECPAERALDVAHAHALNALLEREEDEIYAATLRWAVEDVQSRGNEIQVPSKLQKQLVGSYGPRRVVLEDGKLFYQRENGPRLELVAMQENLFRVGDLDFFRLSFERDAKGKVVRIVGHYDDGRTDGHARDGV